MDDETESGHGQAPILRNSPTILLCFLNLARFYNLEEVPYHHHSQPLQYSHLQNLQIMHDHVNLLQFFRNMHFQDQIYT